MSPSRFPDWNIATGRRDPPYQKSRTFSWLVSDVEPELDHVAVLDDVFLAFDAGQ
jgi:hypothetical protein